MSDDRTVHASHPDGRQIVRYDRAGKWWLEHDPPLMRPARHIGVREAARIALQLEEEGGTIIMGRPGGNAFDRLVNHG